MDLEEAAGRVGGIVRGPHVVVRGVTLSFVPGGTFTLGWDGARTGLDRERREAWEASDACGQSFHTMLRTYLGPRRTANLEPFLLETTTQPASAYLADPDLDVEARLRALLARDGWRLATNDEWEAAARAGNAALFPWGDEWPDGSPYGNPTHWKTHRDPNPYGLVYGSDPYQPELVHEPEWLRHGDGGVAVCGGRPAPEAWYSFAHAFQYPRTFWEDIVAETYETARVRRALSL